MDTLIGTGTIESTREIWWEARPHPTFGTIEVRVCDCPATVDDMVITTALTHALVVWLAQLYDEDRLPEIPLRQLVEENKWKAARYGLDGTFIDYESGSAVGVRDALSKLVADLSDTAAALGSLPYLKQVDRILKRGTSAHRQLEVYGKRNGLIHVVDDLVEMLKK